MIDLHLIPSTCPNSCYNPKDTKVSEEHAASISRMKPRYITITAEKYSLSKWRRHTPQLTMVFLHHPPVFLRDLQLTTC